MLLFRLLFVVFLLIQLITRISLYSYAIILEQLDFSISGLLEVLLLGLLPDIVTFIFFAAGLSVVRLFIPKKLAQSKIFSRCAYILYFIYIALLTFNIAAEVIFWDEFSTRFNFIAVDYLIYTREVAGNIMESYPVFSIVAVILLVSLIIFAITVKQIVRAMQYYTSRKHRFIYAGSYILLAMSSLYFLQIINIDIADRYKNELIKNGIGSLFVAFNDNNLDYRYFYLNKDNQEVFTRLRELLKTKNSKFVNDDVYDLTRIITPSGQKHDYNIILISVESLSADYLKLFGNQNKLTPNLDAIIKSSQIFTKYFAVGTRTVRGLEAMTLSIPPVPGNAIVRRPNNENLSNIGSILKEQGYDTKFIYGGYGYFDNMNYFFAHNGFEVIDRQHIAKEDIIFENIWGVADEVLFNQALKEADRSFANGKNFFSLIMTTSNHRPYTYPENRVAIASGTGRDGAVQYTDYAIGKFINDSRHKPWFKNTIFVITADHCASSAGKQDLPVNKYHIPLIIYAPAIVKTQIYDRYMSQIDLAPTILGMLNVTYTSKFFGNDALLEPKERVFISTYQKLGFLKNETLAILGPKQQADMYSINQELAATPIAINQHILDEAIYYYQGASYSFDQGLLKLRNEK